MNLFSVGMYTSLAVSTLLGQSQTGSASDPASVVGSVVHSQSGDPIKKAQVNLTALDGKSAPIRAITDSEGKFKVTAVPAGTYRVSVSRTGFVRPQARNTGAGHEPVNLAVLPGQEITGLVYRLAPGSVIAGRVLDEDGAPLPGVRIQCLKYSYGSRGPEFASAGFATSDDRGQYRLAGLNPGRYYLRATYTDPSSLLGEVRGGVAQGYPSVYYPGVTDMGQASVLVLREGAETGGMDFKLAPARVVHIQGQVRNPGGRLVGANVIVSLSTRMSGGFGGRPPVPVGADGSFRFDGVTAGSYILTASPAMGGGDTVRQPVEVGETDLDNIRLVLRPRRELQGRVRLVESDRKIPLEGLRVFLSPRDASMLLLGGTGVAYVAADGNFVLHDVADGEYTVAIDELPGDCFVKTVRFGDHEAADAELNIAETNAASVVEILVNAAGGRVDGTLTDEQRPAANVTVVLVPDAARRSRTELYRTATTDQYGRFSIHGIPPGDYKLFAWNEELEPGSWRDPAVLSPYEDRANTLTIEEHGRNSVELQTLRAAR